MFTKKWMFLIVLLFIVMICGCQTATPEAVTIKETVIAELPVTVEVTRVVEMAAEEVVTEVEVTRVVEVVNEVEVTRVVEVAEESASSSIMPLFTTDVREYNSAVSGRDYTAFVVLPLSYAFSDATYPVVYVTDGDVYSLPTAAAAGQLSFGQEMPEVIVVGIGYGTNNPMEWLERREQDMGEEGSESFLQFLQEELIPDIEANYRADPTNRTLAGHSLGGVFSLYTLFNAPETFNRYLASSPGGIDDDCRVCKYEAAFAEGNSDLPAQLFLDVGELDPGVVVLDSFFNTLEGRGYGGLNLETAVLDGETHLSVRPRAFTTGLKWLFTEEQ